MCNQSESITALSEALAKAQGAFHGVRKTGKNPHRNSEYATLDDVINAIRKPLADNGLSFIQPLRSNGTDYVLETRVMHTSGEWIGSSLTIPEMEGNRGMNGLQAFGAALTYVRRYALTTMLGINAETDNDGNDKEAHQGTGQATKAQHWIKDANARKRFWAWTKSLTLTREQVHAALEVEHVEDYEGTKQDAMDAINNWMAEQDQEQSEFDRVVEELYPGTENIVPAGAS
jgi:hypothetical protein